MAHSTPITDSKPWSNWSGSVRFTPASNFTGSGTVSYTVQNASGTTSNVATLTVRVAATDAHVVDDVVGIEARPAFDGRALAPLNNLYIFAGVASGADAAVQSAERLIERAFNLWRYREPPATIHRLFGFTPLSSQTTRKA